MDSSSDRQDNLSDSTDVPSDGESGPPVDVNAETVANRGVPADDQSLAEKLAEYKAFLDGTRPYPDLPNRLRADYPPAIRHSLVVTAQRTSDKIRRMIARAAEESNPTAATESRRIEEGRQLLEFKPPPLSGERLEELQKLSREDFASEIERGWIRPETTISLLRVVQRNDREFPQKALVFQARNEFKDWLRNHRPTLTDHESWVQAYALLAQLTWATRGLADLRQYSKFVAKDVSYGRQVFAAPRKKAFFGDRRFDLRGIPFLLANRGRWFGCGYFEPEPWDNYLVSRLQDVALVDDLDFGPRQQQLIEMWRREHGDLRPRKCPIALTPEQCSDRCRYIGNAISTRDAPPVRMDVCVELLGLAGGLGAITGDVAVPFLPALAAGPIRNEDGNMPEPGQGLWVVHVDIDEPRADKSQPLSMSNMHPKARELAEATWASGGSVEVSQSERGLHAERVFEDKDADKLLQFTQENHIDGLKVEFFAKPPRIVAMTGRPIPGAAGTHDPVTAFRNFEFDCPLGRWLMVNLKSGRDVGPRGRTDLAGLKIVPLEDLPDEHEPGPWDSMTDADVYASVMRSDRSYRQKVEQYEAQPGSVDAHRAEWQLTHLLLDMSGDDQQRTARILREFSPFLIGMSGKGRKAKLASDYVVRTVQTAVVERELRAAKPSIAVEKTAPVPTTASTGHARPVDSGAMAEANHSDAQHVGSPTHSPECGCNRTPPGPGPNHSGGSENRPRRRKPTPFVQNERAREGFQGLSDDRRVYCTFVSDSHLCDRLQEEAARNPKSYLTTLLRELIQSRTPVMPLFLDDLYRQRISPAAADCQEPVHQYARNRNRGPDACDQDALRHSRTNVLLFLDRSGQATAVVPHHFCQSAWCIHCGAPYRARIANHAAITFDRWERDCGALYVSELEPGVSKLPDAARREAAGYFVYTCSGLVISTCDLGRFRCVKSSVRVSHETALRRFVTAILGIPIASVGPGRRHLVDGGRHWDQEGVTEEERRASGMISITLSGGNVELYVEAVRTSQESTPLDVELEPAISESETWGPHRRFRVTNPFVKTMDQLAAWGGRIESRYSELLAARRAVELNAAEEYERAREQIAAWIRERVRIRANAARNDLHGRMAC